MNPENAGTPTPSFDQVLKIYLVSGQVIESFADWNFGLGQFVLDYELFMGGAPQKQTRSQMLDTAKARNTHLNLKFSQIVSICLTKK